MALDRRTVLQAGGTAALASLSGCSALSGLLSGQRQYEYTLTVDALDQSLVDHALYRHDSSDLFATASRTALDDILPEGRHTTYGFEPLPADAYLEYDDRYFQTEVVVTGRERMERKHVRAEPVGSSVTPDDARTADDLPAASRRVVELLHGYHSTDGEGSATELLHEDAYVLRRPAELDGPIADELDGEVVWAGPDGHWAYRISVREEPITETANTTFAVEVAPDHQTFHDIALETRVDATIDASVLDHATRDILESTAEGQHHREETPLSPPFSELIERLGLTDVTVSENGLYLWYDDRLYRYGLYVHPLE